MSPELFWWSGFYIALAGGALAAWALFIRGQPRGRFRCPTCWYDMAGAVPDDDGAHTCPECGRRIVKPTQLRRTRRFWRLAVFGLSLVITGAGLWATPMLRAQHWQRHAPSTLLVMLADADDTRTETWKELLSRAHYDQLSVRHRTILSERLAKGVSPESYAGGSGLRRIIWLRPGRSQALAERMSMFITVRAGSVELRRDIDEWWWQPIDTHHARAIVILGRVGSEADVQTLLTSFTPGRFSRVYTAIALGRIGGDAAIDALTEAVAGDNEKVAIAAAVALAMIGQPASERAEPAIAALFARTDWADERAVLAACLSVLRGDEAHISIPLMRLYVERTGMWQMMSGEHVTESYFLNTLRQEAMPALPLIMSYLDHEDPELVKRALGAFAILGPAAAEALPVLDKMAAKPGDNTWVNLAIKRLRRPN